MKRIFMLALMLALLVACAGEAEKPETAQDWANAFKEAGLECEKQEILKGVGDQLPPGGTSGVAFVIPTHCGGDCGGKVLVFSSTEYAEVMAEWFRELDQHVYVRDTVLVQINSKVPEEVAQQYGAVLDRY